MARTKNQSQRRAEVIQATMDAVGAKGLRSLSMRDVAERAGLTRGAVLYYYEDLDHLLIEAFRSGGERFCDRREEAVKRLGSPADQLALAIRMGLPSGPEDALMRLLYEFDMLAGRSRIHDELVQDLYTRQVGIFTAILEDGVASGQFVPCMDVDTLAMNLVALEDAYGLHIVAGNSMISVEMAETAMREAAAGLGARPAPAPRT